MEANELLKLLNHQWASTTDISAIGSCGRAKAVKIKNEIRNKLGNKIYLPDNKVPMEEVITYFNINMNYLKKIRDLNKEG